MYYNVTLCKTFMKFKYVGNEPYTLPLVYIISIENSRVNYF